MDSGADERVVACLEEEWGAIAALGSELGPAEWSAPTECPGWSVCDVVSHMIGTERSLLGDPAPPAPPAVGDHVRNPLGRSNEAWVHARRDATGDDVLAEFGAVTGRRLAQLRAWPASRFDETGPSPVGVVPYREFMAVRVMDCWVHEQDVRVATGRAVRAEGAAGTLALDRLVSAMGFVVGKKAAAPEGATVRFDITGTSARRIDVTVRDGRGVPGDVTGDVSSATVPTAVLTMDVGAFTRLACGRIDAGRARRDGLVGTSGDDALADAVLGSMAFMI
jgi:uncharacterized protein (TIGR03083 family)